MRIPSQFTAKEWALHLALDRFENKQLSLQKLYQVFKDAVDNQQKVNTDLTEHFTEIIETTKTSLIKKGLLSRIFAHFNGTLATIETANEAIEKAYTQSNFTPNRVMLVKEEVFLNHLENSQTQLANSKDDLEGLKKEYHKLYTFNNYLINLKAKLPPKNYQKLEGQLHAYRDQIENKYRLLFVDNRSIQGLLDYALGKISFSDVRQSMKDAEVQSAERSMQAEAASIEGLRLSNRLPDDHLGDDDAILDYPQELERYAKQEEIRNVINQFLLDSPSINNYEKSLENLEKFKNVDEEINQNEPLIKHFESLILQRYGSLSLDNFCLLNDYTHYLEGKISFKKLFRNHAEAWIMSDREPQKKLLQQAKRLESSRLTKSGLFFQLAETIQGSFTSFIHATEPQRFYVHSKLTAYQFSKP